jgi:hypothetical protein
MPPFLPRPRSLCGADLVLSISVSRFCRSERSALPGRQHCCSARDCASCRASRTLQRIGTVARRFAICCSSQTEVTKERLYRALDRLLEYKSALEAHVLKRKIGAAKNRRCMRSFPAALKRHCSVCPRALRDQKSRSTRLPSSGRSAASCSETGALLRALRSACSRTAAPRGFGLPSLIIRHSTSGLPFPRAPICCVPTSLIGTSSSCGRSAV